ncbi:MAG TPA: glycosyltransferase family 39 protein [Bacteroidales bacterium]|jgi:4-amino-4-deoxy-L-arabinose transferase-like glycosyltransferase|nr:glycosyltransferase family 39 protein [Bacteroidales bacterium]MDI9574283.1 glycosyltransferase family 39 protein [Bacteroidota bacterium]MBP9512406.1 glycosyltransferase family 39 protein [Bacteroidales bacterium]MBP9589334.1 glycosyltransferase family 39 protein [Bacteroidales bacterium]HOE59606.1 glycosyltransferase family 39 protein [Bacteroidales bacterium]
MKTNERNILLILLGSSFLIRFLLSFWLELGNDEVYYYTYALYPAWSYFDHPPMVGWVIRIFSLNLLVQGEWAVRFASVALGTLNTYLIYVLGKFIKNREAGIYAALLYTSSIYCFVIFGLFILPDTPQSTFWLLAIFAFLKSIISSELNKNSRSWLLAAGVFTGLAMLSKYTSAFLWAGAGAYILFFNRKWLKSKELYISILLSALFFLPVILWNVQNDWISFTYHGERVDFSKGRFRIDYLMSELGGQFLYNNPVAVVTVFIAAINFMKGKHYISKPQGNFLLLISFPIIFIFIIISTFRATLPHWSGPGYHALILMGGCWLAWKRETSRQKKIPFHLRAALSFLILVLIAGIAQIQFNLLIKPDVQKGVFRGKKDFSLDMYGWRQMGKNFSDIQQRDEKQGKIRPNAPIISFRWFPAANLDYYVAKPNQTYVLAMGNLERIHHYAWINQYRGGFHQGMDAWYIVSGRDYKDPSQLCEDCWATIVPTDTVPIIRNHDTVMYFLIYHLKNLQTLPADPLTTIGN